MKYQETSSLLRKQSLSEAETLERKVNLRNCKRQDYFGSNIWTNTFWLCYVSMSWLSITCDLWSPGWCFCCYIWLLSSDPIPVDFTHIKLSSVHHYSYHLTPNSVICHLQYSKSHSLTQLHFPVKINIHCWNDHLSKL